MIHRAYTHITLPEWPENICMCVCVRAHAALASFTHFHEYFRLFLFSFFRLQSVNFSIHYNFMGPKLVAKFGWCRYCWNVSFFGGRTSETASLIDKLASNWWSFIIFEFHNVIKLCTASIECHVLMEQRLTQHHSNSSKKKKKEKKKIFQLCYPQWHKIHIYIYIKWRKRNLLVFSSSSFFFNNFIRLGSFQENSILIASLLVCVCVCVVVRCWYCWFNRLQ